MRQVRLTPQALKDLKGCDDPTREGVQEALRHLADHPLDANHFQKDKVWSYRVWPYRMLYRRVGYNWLDVLSFEHRNDVYR